MQSASRQTARWSDRSQSVLNIPGYDERRQSIEEDAMAKGNNARKKETKKPKKDKK